MLQGLPRIIRQIPPCVICSILYFYAEHIFIIAPILCNVNIKLEKISKNFKNLAKYWKI